MTVTRYYYDLRIEVYDDPAYHNMSPHILTSYGKIYQPEEDKEYATHSQHAIAVYKHDESVSSAILLGTSGATSVTDASVIIDAENLIIRCSNNLFSLTLPDLQLNWMKEVDWVTCFSIYLYKGTYITHGELSVCRVDRNGKRL